MIRTMIFKDELSKRVEETNLIIDSYIPEAGSHDREIIDAMRYSVDAGGKRLRPVLMKSFYTLFGGKGDCVKPFMAAMEMLHTYSLVHDDLPALDNDDYRRGRYTTHKQYGEPLAILAGDGLLHQAYETAIKAFDLTEDTGTVVKALKIFGDKTGIHGMLGGQTADVINTGRMIDDDLMYYIYENKTGALIEGSMMIGAALAGAGEDECNLVKQIGSCIGMAFQIQDDLLDIYGDEKTLGKPVGSDDRNDKKTYVTVNGVSKSKSDIIGLTNEAYKMLEGLGSDDNERTFLKDMFGYLISRDN